MIESLTEEQVALLSVYRDKWVARAIRTDWDPEAVKAAVPDIYKAAGLDQPKDVYLTDSPVAAAKLAAELLDTPGEWVPPHDGAGWCSWRAFYSFFLDEFGIGEELRPYYKLDDAGAFWWYFFDEAFIACAPPKYMRFDQGDNDRRIPYRYHCEDGPALEWEDGTKMYFWKGVGIPGEWVDDPNFLTAEMVFKLDNVELRRVAGEIMGWDKILLDLDGEIIQKDDYGELISVKLPGVDEASRFIRVTCPSSGRVYVNPVPRDTQMCREGLAWRFGVEKMEDYKPLVES